MEFKGSTTYVGKDGGGKVPIKWGLIERVSHLSGDTGVAYTWGDGAFFNCINHRTVHNEPRGKPVWLD